jgi:hypothetical protein
MSTYLGALTATSHVEASTTPNSMTASVDVVSSAAHGRNNSVEGAGGASCAQTPITFGCIRNRSMPHGRLPVDQGTGVGFLLSQSVQHVCALPMYYFVS